MSPLPPAAWPATVLDPVGRLRVLSRVLPGVHLVERELPFPQERVWAFLSDLERSVPLFDETVRSLRVVEREGSRLRIVTRTRLGLPLPFDVDLEPGFMLMRAPLRIYLVGLAAVALGPDRTWLAQLEGTPTAAGRVRQRRVARHVEHDVAGIERHLRDGLS